MSTTSRPGETEVVRLLRIGLKSVFWAVLEASHFHLPNLNSGLLLLALQIGDRPTKLAQAVAELGRR